jgi:hypothetical protein
MRMFAALVLLPLLGSATSQEGGDAIVEKPRSRGATVSVQAKEHGIDWGPLLKQSLFFTTIQHSFRLATEPGTREGFRGSYWRGWGQSVRSMHGWADGDPFYVNYVGHPLQGSTSGYLFVQNDPAYRDVQFGLNRRYWRSRMRAMAFAWAYSTQFEIGLLSEAMIGKIQATPPQQGFVDHVVTPTIGVGAFMVAEDMLDRYVIRWFESRVRNPYARMMMRGWLNPARSMANMLRFEAPWRRDFRGAIFTENPLAAERESPPETVSFTEPMSDTAPFEFTADARFLRFSTRRAGGLCAGGGATGAFRLSPTWQLLADVGGCKLAPVNEPRGGDLMLYAIGPRWTAEHPRWRPHFQMLVGGQKATLAKQETENAFAVGAGAGIDVRLNRAVALRLANLEYRHAWMNDPRMRDYRTSIRLSSGLVLQMGSW